MEEFIIFCLNVAFWYFVINTAIKIFIGMQVAKVEQTVEIKEKLAKMIHRIKQEKHGDIYYWFDSDDDQFLAQGRTDTEIIDALKNRFPTHIFVLNNEKALRGPEWKLTPIADLTKKSV
jgi:hypothetical protein